MEEKSTGEDLCYDFMDRFTEVLMTDMPHDIDTIAINHGVHAGFSLSHLEMGEYRFETHAEELVVKKNGQEIGKCPNTAFVFDWLVGMAIYLKERNLMEDFKQFYMF